MDWIQYKNSPHIQYNEQTRMFRCSTCNIDLNNNPGGAGKHSTKIHNVTLSGKPVPKVQKTISPQFTIEDALEEIIDNRKKIEQKIEKLEGKVDAANAKIDKVQERFNAIVDYCYTLETLMKITRTEQNKMTAKCDKSNKRYDDIMSFVRVYFMKTILESK